MKHLTLVLLALVFFLTGCETMQGFGKDMQKAGRWMQKKAD